MKKILLASAASFAFAGAAAADITFSGSANVGFGELSDQSSGFVAGDGASTVDSAADTLNGRTGVQLYQNISITAALTGETDTGLAFGASLTMRSGDDLDLDAGDLEYDGDLSNFSYGNIFISGEWGKLTFDRDGNDNVKDDDSSHDLKYEYGFDAWAFALTYDLNNDDTVVDGAGEQWSASVGYTMDPFSASLATDNSGEFDVTLGYQITSEIKVSYKYESDGDNGNGENTLTGAYNDGTFNASLALSDVDGEWDLGLGYTANGITVGANYGDTDSGDEEWDLSAAYDLGGGLTVKAMANESDAYYVGLAMSF